MTRGPMMARQIERLLRLRVKPLPGERDWRRVPVYRPTEALRCPRCRGRCEYRRMTDITTIDNVPGVYEWACINCDWTGEEFRLPPREGERRQPSLPDGTQLPLFDIDRQV